MTTTMDTRLSELRPASGTNFGVEGFQEYLETKAILGWQSTRD